MSEWISVDDRLPSKPDPEIVFDSVGYLVSDGDRVCVVRFDRGHGCGKPWAEWNTYGDIAPREITHWQPLPSPPPEQDK